MFRTTFYILIVLAVTTTLISNCSKQEKAAAIHQKALTVDTHTDTPMRLVRSDFDPGVRHEAGRKSGLVDFPRMKEGGLDAVFFAVFTSQGARDDSTLEQVKTKAIAIFDSIHAAVEKNSGQAGIALTPDDAYRLEKEGKRAIFIGMENGYPIGKDLSLISTFKKMGARYITLCHTSNNDICDSSTDDNGPEHNGLSAFGKEVVREMNRLGIMVDISHTSDKSVRDVLQISTAPVIASHSCAKAVNDNPRNLSDSLLQAIADDGGVIQVCLLSEYVKHIEQDSNRTKALSELRAAYRRSAGMSDEQKEKLWQKWEEVNEKYPPKKATVSDLVDHIDHIVQVAGIDHVGIGSDFDGGGGLADCRDVSEMGNITEELVNRGYSEDDIIKIWGGNVMRVLREVQKRAQQPTLKDAGNTL